MSEEMYTIDARILEVRRSNGVPQAVCFLYEGRSHWVPFSLVHDDSEAYDVGHSGKLVIPLWKAQELGLAQEPKKRPLPRKGERERQVVSTVVQVLRDKARALRAKTRPKDLGAICECGACDPADPIGWHEAEILERVATEIESAVKL